MLPLGMVLGLVSYGVSTWGYVLVKGYNITLREWFSPLHPFTGALDGNGCVPQGYIFPRAGKGGPCSSGPAKQGDLNPGTTTPGPHARGVVSRF
jgi:hypothetical protein